MKKSTKPDPLNVNQQTISKVLSCSVNTIVNWDREGLPSTKQGKERVYSIPLCVAWYLERQLGKLSSLSEEQSRFVKIKRQRQELALQKERRELIVAEDAKTYFTMLGLHLKGRLEALPHRLSGRLASLSETRPITLLLKKEMKDVLSSFREMKLQ